MAKTVMTCDPRVDPMIEMEVARAHFATWAELARVVGVSRTSMSRLSVELKLEYLPPLLAHRLMWYDPDVFMRFAPNPVEIVPPKPPPSTVRVVGNETPPDADKFHKQRTSVPIGTVGTSPHSAGEA